MNRFKGDTMNFKHLLRRGTTFALLLFGLFAILAPDPVSAQLLVGKAGPFSGLPPCSLDPIYNSAGRFAVVTDATVDTGVITAGGGTPALGYCELDGGDWLAFAFTNPSGLSADASILIEATGATHDLTLAAVDDLVQTGNDILPTAVATYALVAPVTGVTATTSFTVTSPVQLQTATTSATVTSPVQLHTATTSFTVTSPVQLQTATTSSTVTSPVQVNTASTSILNTTPKSAVSGNYEYSVATVTVADDAAGTKPAGVITITTDIVLGECNDATGSTLTITEPTVTVGYGRRLTLISMGTGNCELADSAGVLELSGAAVLEPNSTLSLVYANAAWHELSRVDNVP